MQTTTTPVEETLVYMLTKHSNEGVKIAAFSSGECLSSLFPGEAYALLA